jgi:predicted O-methyltransferase YrrM
MINFAEMPKTTRAAGFEKALSLLYSRCLYPVIVETGTIRNEDSPEDGWSTLVFGWFCHKYGGKLYTIDFNAEHIEISKRITSQYAENIEYIVGRGDDSIAALDTKLLIDFLYLDSAHGLNAAWEEYLQAKPKLHPRAIIMIDDADHKGKKAIPKLREDGWEVIAYIHNPCHQAILERRYNVDN